MRSPRILVYEHDGRLAALLRSAEETGPAIRDREQAQGWSLREPRRLESCLRLTRHGGPCILIVRVATKLEPNLTVEKEEQEARRRLRAFQLLEAVQRLRPDTSVVAVSDQDDAALSGLAWDLGATLVLFPPRSLAQLPALVAGLMAKAEAGS